MGICSNCGGLFVPIAAHICREEVKPKGKRPSKRRPVTVKKRKARAKNPWTPTIKNRLERLERLFAVVLKSIVRVEGIPEDAHLDDLKLTRELIDSLSPDEMEILAADLGLEGNLRELLLEKVEEE